MLLGFDFDPLPRLDCDITQTWREETRALLARTVGRDFCGSPALVVGQNANFDDPETFRALNAADALAHISGYVQVWGNPDIPCNVHPALRPVYEKCLAFQGDECYFTLLMRSIKGVLFVYMPHDGLELRVRIYVPEEHLPDAVASIERSKGDFQAFKGAQ